MKARIYAEEERVEKLSWSEVNRRHKGPCPDVLSLMDLILTIPASSADCERGFSTMKQVSTHYHFDYFCEGPKRVPVVSTHLLPCPFSLF